MVCALLFLVGLTVQTSAQSESPPNDTPHGDWLVKVNVNGEQRTSILSLSNDPQGKQSGRWIGLEELSELKDIKYEAGKLSFTGKGPNRDGQSRTWKFTGTIKDDKLSGTVSRSDRGEHTVKGDRITPLPDIVGNYGFNYSPDDCTAAVAVRIDQEGKLTAKWLISDGKVPITDAGEVPITDLMYEKGKLTFESKLGSYKGSLTQRKSLNGTYTTEAGEEYSVLSQRLGTPMIGAWNLEVMSEQGSRHQRLKVNRDMSGWYGAIPIKEVHLQGDDPQRPNRPRTVTFKTVMKSGERTVEMSFTGKVTEGQLSGEITTPAGTAKVVGKKLVQTLRTGTTP